MRLSDFETLIWISRLGSFTAAADRLRITQSAITRRVRELEASLGIKLFHRTGRRVRLTADGQICLEYSNRFVSLSSEMKRELGQISKMKGTVRVGVGETIAMWWLPNFVLASNTLFPEISLEIDVDLSARHISRFERGELDLLFLPGVPPSQGNHVLVHHIPFAWMAGPRLGVPDGSIGADDLSRWPLLTLPEPSNSFKMLRTWFLSSNVRPQTIHFCNSLMVVAALAAAGMGIALLPISIFQDKIMSGQLKVIATDPPVDLVPVWIIYGDGSGLPLADLADIAYDISHGRG